jgi:hypothetical protein
LKVFSKQWVGLQKRKILSMIFSVDKQYNGK